MRVVQFDVLPDDNGGREENSPVYIQWEGGGDWLGN